MSITLIPTTDQEAFDMVVAHLKTMKRRSTRESAGMSDAEFAGIDPLNLSEEFVISEAMETEASEELDGGIDWDTICMYRTKGGSRCAIGCLIRDEGTGIALLIELEIVDPGNLDVDLLAHLQLIHDDHANWDSLGFRGWHDVRDLGVDKGFDVSKVPS